MKAIILAAGKGERLKEITNSIPKPMIEFKGKPILEHNIDLCRRNGITEIYINLYHLHEKITNYFGNGKEFGVNIKYSYEKELLGTAGAVKKIAKDLWGFKKFNIPKTQQLNLLDPFFVIYGDNYTNYDLSLLSEKLNKTNSSCIIAFHHRGDVTHSGVAEFYDDYRIKQFFEKPPKGTTESHWVNAGIYLLKIKFLNFIGDGVLDFGKDIFPQILGMNIPIYGICKNNIVKAFDTPDLLMENMNDI